MIVRFLLVFLLMAVGADGSTLDASGRGEINQLLRELEDSAGAKAFPEEWESFFSTVSAAQRRLSAGDRTGAESLFELALMKGELLAGRIRGAAPLSGSLAGGASHRMESPVAFPPAAEEKEQFAEEIEESVFEDEWGLPAAEPLEIRSPRIIGGEGVYTVRRNDTLKLIASRLGVSLRELARLNRLNAYEPLKTGQRLHYNNRRIVPKTLVNGILINIPERSLYLFKGGNLSARYPVALGMARKKDKTSWRTPTGRFRVLEKIENPSWTVPLSIRREMERNGEEVLSVVPPGPRNPLGKHAIKTSLGGIMIHGTSKPTSINSFSSHGCIRVMPEHMDDLFRTVTISMPGEIIYQPVKVAVTGEGRVFLEVNHDAYGRVDDIRAEVKRTLHKHRAGDRVSWNRVMRVISDSKGIAEEITSH